VTDRRCRSYGARICFPIANYKHFAPLERETLICVETNDTVDGRDRKWLD